jgi:hypothetical protein
LKSRPATSYFFGLLAPLSLCHFNKHFAIATRTTPTAAWSKVPIDNGKSGE